MKKPFLLLVISLALSACSVKEDRGNCPCLLSLIPAEAFEAMEENPGTELKLTLRGYAEEGTVVEECFGIERVRDTLEFPVKKGELVMTAWLTCAGVTVSGERFLIPSGEEAQPLYACREVLEASGETVRFIPHPLKKYSTLLFLDDSGAEVPFRGRKLIIRGRSCGLDLTTMQSVEGDFECPARAAEHLSGRGFQVRIPRQEDASLELELTAQTAGEAILRLPLGEALFAQEFTPADEEMPDYIVWLNATGSSLGISSIITVCPWK